MTGPTRILAIDDDLRLRNLISAHLTQKGYECVLAEDGRSALSRAAEGGYDVILCDVVLPGTDGISLNREFQRLCPGVPVVFMTGSATSDTALRALQSGAADFLPKPFHLTALDETLRRALARRADSGTPPPGDSWDSPEETAIRRSMSTIADLMKELGPAPHSSSVDPGLVALVDALGLRLGASPENSRVARWAARLSGAEPALLDALATAGEAVRAIREHGTAWNHGTGRTSDGQPIPYGARCLAVASRTLRAVDSSRWRPGDDARAALRMAGGTELDPEIVDACVGLPDPVFDALARRTPLPVVPTPADQRPRF